MARPFSFTHLHVHTRYSIQTGAIRLHDLYPRLVKLGMSACAITDLGTMSGVMDFYRNARRNHIKPIIGCEVYVAADHTDREDRRTSQLVLLASTNVGYRNLLHLSTRASIAGFFHRPRIDLDLLRDHAQGLIALSAGLRGAVACALDGSGPDAAEQTAQRYCRIFAPGDYYLELVASDEPEQRELNDTIAGMGRRLGIPLVATANAFYLNETDAQSVDVLRAIRSGLPLGEDDGRGCDAGAGYVRSAAQMHAAFAKYPDAVTNTLAIADRCNVDIPIGETLLPRFRTAHGDSDLQLEALVRRRLGVRFKQFRQCGKRFDPDVYHARIVSELAVIREKRVSDYFLIVSDYVDFACRNGITVGPGRGSSGGCCVAYALGITDVDPIVHGLLFERFLNPARRCIPDIDLDVSTGGRDKIVSYLRETYGEECVAPAARHMPFQGVSALRAVAMTMGYTEDDVRTLIERFRGNSLWGPAALKESLLPPELAEWRANDPRIARLIELARAIEYLKSHIGPTPGNLIISDGPLWDRMPCLLGPTDALMSAWDRHDSERAGPIVYNFLELDALSDIGHTLRLIGEECAAHGTPPLSLADIPIDDPDTYGMLCSGDNDQVFGLASAGMRDVLERVQPDCFGDLTAAIALHRPGPLDSGMLDDYVDRKHGRKDINYIHKSLEPILADTYGVIVYQEQTMQVVHQSAGFSLADADLLRRDLGKKSNSIEAEWRPRFVAGASSCGIEQGTAEQVFDLLVSFAGYGFSRAHSVAYSLIAYRMAYLAVHYPEASRAAHAVAARRRAQRQT